MKDCGGKNLAIAYAMKRKGKKYAEGGDVMKPERYKSDQGTSAQGAAVRSGNRHRDWSKSPNASWPSIERSMAKDSYAKAKEIQKTKPRLMAEGGFVHDEEESGFVDHEGDDVKHDYAAMHEDDRDLNQHGEEEEGPQGVWMADGGMLTKDGYQDEDHEMDMVGRVMKQRQRMYSKGGMVANGGEDELDHMADGDPNNFDYLSMNDDLEDSDTGDNSGDKLDNSAEDHDREDIISRIMKSRSKKDSLPKVR